MPAIFTKLAKLPSSLRWNTLGRGRLTLHNFRKNSLDLHRSINKYFGDEDELFHEYIKTGCQIFGMETGIISKIEGDSYQIMGVSSPIEDLQKGMIKNLEDTYCREVYYTRKTLALPHVGKITEYQSHPIYQRMKLESYIASPIFVDNQIYGTINFTDRKKADFHCSKDIEIIEIMSGFLSLCLENRLTNHKLKSQNMRVNQLIGNVAHDLRTPISQISSMAELLSENVTIANSEDQFLVDKIIEASSFAMDMFIDLLNYSAVSSGKLSLEKSKVNLSDLLLASWKLVEHKAKAKNVSLELDTKQVNVEIDAKRIRQVFCNLFSNAIKFSNRNSKIVSRVSVTKDGLSICEVTDQGIGISPEHEKDLFRSDIPTSTSGTEGEQGTGFGLPFAAEIMELHGASIKIKSEKFKGTTFQLIFPNSIQ